LAWSFIREVSSLEANVVKALNGLGPVRPAAYEDPRVQERLPYANAEAQAIQRARVPLPGFANSARVEDIYLEEMQAALIGAKSPQQAMDDAARRVQPLMPN
jgi:multiple sugar transport system substrate-binding protein